MLKTTPHKKYRLAMLMLAVVIPGLIISGLGVISISQQEKAKEIKSREKYTNDLDRLRKEIESETKSAVNSTFQQLFKNPTLPAHPDSLQQTLKDLLLNNPIVQYPFLIDSSGEFIFPFSRKSPVPFLESSFPRISDKRIESYFRDGERLEFGERKYPTALKSYVKCLEYPEAEQIKPYIFNAIGRCYFKLGRFPQALSYYRSIDGYYQGNPSTGKDFSLYFPVLRQIARVYQLTGALENAVRAYLRLYDEILRFETSNPPDKFAFYKNEALEFLNQYLRVRLPQGLPDMSDKPGKERGQEPDKETTFPGTGLSPDRLREFTGPEISLRWQYFDYEDSGNVSSGVPGLGIPGETAVPAETSGDFLRFMKIREFYLAADEKTQFYKTVKELDDWENLSVIDSSLNEFETRQITSPDLNHTFEVVFKRFPESSDTPVHGSGQSALSALSALSAQSGQSGQSIFGFRLSPGFLSSARIFNILSGYIQEPGLKVIVMTEKDRLAGFPEGGGKGYPLISTDFEAFFPGFSLVLVADEKNFFTLKAREEIRLNYLLMTALLLVLILGVYLFYKYLSREAELVRLKSEFTDQASHSLKTPLTRIRMLAEKLQLGWVSSEEKKQEYLRTILTESDRMNEMIVNMLDFSKIEAGRKQYHLENKSLPLAVKEVLELYSPYIRGLGFQLQVEIDEALPLFPMDSDAVKLILVNLLQNAVKYSPAEKFIAVRLCREGEAAVLEVRDRGIGIEEKELKQIFERFYRSEVETVQTVEGSGLGLFLVRHAMRAHGGEIHVSSQPGKGSCFAISFPLGDGR